MALDPLAPVREAFIRVLDNARPLKDLDPELPAELRERATVGLVAIGLADLRTIEENARKIQELLQGKPAALETEAGRQCSHASVLIAELLEKLPRQ